MKFLTKLDAKLFLSEIQSFDKLNVADENYNPTSEEIGLFLKARTPLIKKIKNHRKSSAQKANWRNNRQSMMKGIKAFHKSTDGKRFHKRLGKFLATRIFRKAEDADGFKLLIAKQGVLKGINAARQHLLVELEYFHPMQEQIEIEEFLVDYAFPYFRAIESKIITSEELELDEIAFLFDITDKGVIIQKLSEMVGQKFAQIEKLWNSIHNEISTSGVTIENDSYYAQFFTKFKNGLKQK